MKQRQICLIGAACAFAIVAGGCGTDKGSTAREQSGVETKPKTNTAVKAEPVTIKLATKLSNLSEEEWKRYAVDPVKKKYPHMTLELVDLSQKGNAFSDLVSAGNVPDLYLDFAGTATPFLDLKLDSNIEPLIKQQQFDVNRITPEYLNTLKAYFSKDYLIGLPFYNNAFGLFYNKNLFDKFGVPYPKDGMTWEEVRNTAVRLSRTDNGVQYYGLHPENVQRGAYQLSLPFLDLKNDKAMLQTPEWKELFELWYSLYKIPGGEIPKTLNFQNDFYQGRIAMIAGYSILINNMNAAPGLQWDVVTYPVNPKAPGVASGVNSTYLYVTSTTKHAADAFKVITVLLSEDVQTDMGRQGKTVPVLKDRSVLDQFGKDIPTLQAKNVVALTKPKLAELQPIKYPFTLTPATIAINAFNSVAFDGVDINTALRTADEQLNQEIRKFK